MSHTVKIKTALRDAEAIRAACSELGLEAPREGTVSFHDRQSHSGWIVQLKDWRYPVVVNKETGDVSFDNYNGSWGDITRLNNLTQMYGIHKASMEARKKGYWVQRTPQQDGSVKLTIGGLR